MEEYDWDALNEDWGAERVTMVQAVGQLIVQGKLAADVLKSLDFVVPGLKNQMKHLEKQLKDLERRLNILERLQKRQN